MNPEVEPAQSMGVSPMWQGFYTGSVVDKNPGLTERVARQMADNYRLIWHRNEACEVTAVVAPQAGEQSG
ncbi:MAG: hypothetical protein JSS02_29480 [Planctomycetes bacterium]|nr:hypothetical protein [Planctomycetota bacterium]